MRRRWGYRSPRQGLRTRSRPDQFHHAVVYPCVYFGILANNPVTKRNPIRMVYAHLVANQGFKSLKGPLPELELVLGGRRVCTEMWIKQDLIQQRVVVALECPRRRRW